MNTNMLEIALKAGRKKVGENYKNLIRQKKMEELVLKRL